MLRSALRCTFLHYAPYFLFFFNDTATTEIYTLSLHDALPIWLFSSSDLTSSRLRAGAKRQSVVKLTSRKPALATDRSEEHTSELQSQSNLVCRLLLEKKNKNSISYRHSSSTTAHPAVG